MEFTLGQIAGIIDGKVEGNSEIKVSAIGSIEEARSGSVSFLSNPKYESHIYQSQASGVIVNHDFKPQKELTPVLIRVKNAYLAFTTLLQEYQRIMNFSKSGIEKPNYLPESTSHGENLYLGAFSYIGENVTIGANVKIYPHTYIGDNVTIGDNCIIYPNVTVYQNCKIGNYCTLQAGVAVGSHGFGFAPKEDGSYENIPQVGNVILEDHVDVGANTTIDCATFESTIIRKGVKLDNLVQIAHNVEVGENTVIASQSGISGSTKVGKQVIIAGQVGIVGHLHIADKTTIGAQSGILRNSKEGETIWGTPAMDKGQQAKSLVIFRKLPSVMKRIEELEEKILNLPSN
ncbi:MAG: UDP-3-O-(3-hydroxymyristoyl)glucosamine N-acyltransferase [Cytophagales bacterium]|nr:UDP-3-O-(3-hydroxymyristoyl)glucosamine N-acyltransferase [Cytophagales bacterium]